MFFFWGGGSADSHDPALPSPVLPLTFRSATFTDLKIMFSWTQNQRFQLHSHSILHQQKSTLRWSFMV